MRQDVENLVVQPLFYETLSGEFTPQSSPEHSLTLGRLMVVSFLAGKYSLEGDDGTTRYPFFEYIPSWAPDVKVAIEGEILDDNLGDETYRATGIQLRRGARHSELLYVHNEIGSETNEIKIETPIGTSHRYNIALGEDLPVAKKAISEVATIFFSS